jgi:hypothetical protein
MSDRLTEYLFKTITQIPPLCVLAMLVGGIGKLIIEGIKHYV